MPKPTYATCRGCGKHRDEVGLLSHTRLCRTCAVAAVTENVTGLYLREGPALQRWRRGMAASVGALLVDDIPRES